jgi:hypothetical protein
MNPADPTRPADAPVDPVSVTEIADFLRQLRGLSRPPIPGGDPRRDPAAERAAFLARKADLFARIAAGHPELAAPTTTPTTARQDGGSA